MSHGPPRPYAHNYSNMPASNLSRQQPHQSQVINNQQSFQQALVTSSPPTIGHVQQANSNSTSAGSNNTSASSPSSVGRGINPNATQETMYCDSCQTFRHVSFFHERDFKYNVCNICHTREMQKRKHQLERYEMYEEQQRTYKQARYHQIQYATPQQQQQQQQQHQQQQLPPAQLHSSAPINLNSSSAGNSPLPPPQTLSSPQIKQSPPSSNIMQSLSQVKNNTNTNTNNNKSNMFTNSTMRNQPQLQPHLHSQQVMSSTISLPLPNQQTQQQQQSPDLHQIPPASQIKHESLLHRLDKSNTIVSNNLPNPLPPTNSNSTPITLPPTTLNQPTPNVTASTTVLTPPVTHHKNTSTSAERAAQEVIDLDTFVRELEGETEFDRKQYHLDIGPLMESMGENPGFTQLGRGICERVLEGTKFNFR